MICIYNINVWTCIFVWMSLFDALFDVNVCWRSVYVWWCQCLGLCQYHAALYWHQYFESFPRNVSALWVGVQLVSVFAVGVTLFRLCQCLTSVFALHCITISAENQNFSSIIAKLTQFSGYGNERKRKTKKENRETKKEKGQTKKEKGQTKRVRAVTKKKKLKCKK